MIDERKAAIRYRVTAPPLNFDDFLDDIAIDLNKTGFSGKSGVAALSPKKEITSALSDAGSPRSKLNKTVQIMEKPQKRMPCGNVCKEDNYEDKTIADIDKLIARSARECAKATKAFN